MIYKVKLLIYDFDGVMTDNKVYLDQDGREIVQVNRADGLAVSEIRKLGVEQIIISSEENYVVSARAQKLGIKCFQGVKDKVKVLSEFCEGNNISLDAVAFVGNDINDLKLMETLSLTYCPSDAHRTIKDISSHILKSPGGAGVIRELLDHLIHFQN